MKEGDFMKFEIKNLGVLVFEKEILNNFNLEINTGEIHAIMGPNGVGKSTLSKVIMGDKNYKVKSGDILYNDKSILNLDTSERSKLGIFLAMQNPIEIDGVTNQDFLRTAISIRNGKNIGLYDFILKSEKALDELKMDRSMIHRNLNSGFSGGEKKKNEVLQIKLLKPNFIILDELDSGLDIDSLKIVCDNINEYLKENKNVSVLIITHYPRILEYIKPDFVHIMLNGQLVKTADISLALEVEKNGYKNVLDKTNIIDGEVNHE